MPVCLKARAIPWWQPPQTAESTYCALMTPVASRQATRNPMACHTSVPQPQSHLHEARLIELRRNHAEGGVCRRRVREVRLAKLNAIEKVEGFRAKFHIEAFSNRCSFEHSEVVVGDARTPQARIRAALVTKSVWRGKTKAG